MIVIGHFLNSDNFPKVVLYTFHVPLFFFISGYLFSPKKSICVFLGEKVSRLMMPYGFYAVLSIILYISFSNDGRSLTQSNIQHLFYWRGSVLWNAPLWFLPALFEIMFASYFLCQPSMLWCGKNGRWLSVILLVIAGVMGVAIGSRFLEHSRGGLLGINKALLMLPYFSLGMSFGQ